MKEDIIPFYIPQTPLPFSLRLAGISYCDGKYRISRVNSSRTILECVVKGTGYLNIDGAEYTASEGDVYIIRQGTTHFYYSDDQDPWIKIWFNMQGVLPEKILDAYGFPKIGVVVEQAYMEHDFRRMLKMVSNQEVPQTEIFEGMAAEFLRTVIKLSKIYQNKDTLSYKQKNGWSEMEEMNRLIEFIDSHPNRIVSNEELAAVIFRSKDYCIRKFAKNFGKTPYQYQISQKIDTAKNLLKNSSLSIADIAVSLGYDDSYNFSTLFRKHCGVSPNRYRQAYFEKNNLK